MRIADTHCDTLTKIFDEEVSLEKNDLHIDMERLRKYDGFAQFFACFISPEHRYRAKKRVIEVIEYSGINVARSFQDYRRIIEDGGVAAFLTIEGGEAIERIEDIQLYYDLGVRMIGLTWNHDNRLAGGVLGDEARGLTEYGRQVVVKMNSVGILVDVSHLNEKSFWDVSECSRAPIIATHSNSYAICPNKRNLTDEQFLMIKETDGYVGINLYSEFLSTDKTADISDILKHIEYFLALGGEDIIGLGCDFDGVDSLPEGIEGVSDLYKIFDEMARLGYTQTLMNKIAHKNCEKIIKLF